MVRKLWQLCFSVVITGLALAFMYAPAGALRSLKQQTGSDQGTSGVAAERPSKASNKDSEPTRAGSAKRSGSDHGATLSPPKENAPKKSAPKSAKKKSAPKQSPPKPSAPTGGPA